MPRADYRRPSVGQIRKIFRCDRCGDEVEAGPQEDYAGARCGSCLGTYYAAGEGYPSSSEEWDEERDSMDGQWRRRT